MHKIQNHIIDWVENLQNITPFKQMSQISETKLQNLFWLSVGILIFLSAYFYSKDLHLKYAHMGYTPAQYVYNHAFPENFEKNFPSGTENFSKSSFMHIYKVAYEYAGFKPLEVNVIIIWLEVILLAITVLWFVKSLLPNAPPLTQYLCLAVFIAGHIRFIDLANFGGVLFYGHYYVINDILRMIAIVSFLKRKIIFVALIAGILFTIHPVHTFFLAILLLSIFATQYKLYNHWGKIFTGVLIFCAISVPWFLSQYGLDFISGAKNGKSIDKETWMAFAKFGNHHFFTTDLGMRFFKGKLIPFLALGLIWVLYYKRDYKENDFAKSLFIPTIIVFILSLSGLIIMNMTTEPTFIKLALQRMSNLFLLVTLPFILNSLRKDVMEGAFLQQIFAASLFILAYMNSAWASLGFGLALIMVYLAIKKAPTLTGITFKKPLVSMLCFLIVPMLSYSWLTNVNYWASFHIKSEKRYETGIAYEATQKWIHDKTPYNALIMVPPDERSSGQSVMIRSSFGTIRDWIHDCCLYNGDVLSFEEGLKRIKSFDVNIEEYLSRLDKPSIYVHNDLQKDIGAIYHAQSPQWYQNYSNDFSIDYMVFRKYDMIGQLPESFKKMYENKLYIIYKTSS